MGLSKLLALTEDQIQELTIMEQMTWWIWETEEINMKIRNQINGLQEETKKNNGI